MGRARPGLNWLFHLLVPPPAAALFGCNVTAHCRVRRTASDRVAISMVCFSYGFSCGFSRFFNTDKGQEIFVFSNFHFNTSKKRILSDVSHTPGTNAGKETIPKFSNGQNVERSETVQKRSER